MTISAFIRQHPVIAYFILTFAISWGLVLFSIGVFNGLPGTIEEFQTLIPYVVLAMLLGPSISGILLTGVCYGTLSLSLYLPGLLFSFLPPYRILMVWVYDRTQSLLIAMLMHASLTASVRIFDPLEISGMPLLIYNFGIGIAFWIVVIIIAFKTKIFWQNPIYK